MRLRVAFCRNYEICSLWLDGKITRTDAAHKFVGWILTVACAVSILSHAQGPADVVNAQPRNAEIRDRCTNRDNGRPFARTELFFGRAKPDGSMVTDEEFRSFLDKVITPRFASGLTALPVPANSAAQTGWLCVKDPCL
jgi:hypothetical protein